MTEEAGFALDPAHAPEAVASPTLWLPYAPMARVRQPLPIAAAEGPRLHLEDGRTLIDAVSSWWSVIHGYNHPELTAAVNAQMQQTPHVMLGGLVHNTTQQLADKLVEVTPEPLKHVFFGDSGSVGVEIALKMAVQYWQNQGVTGKQRLLALKKAYHGDTAGAMSVCDPDEGMHSLFSGIVPRQHFAEAPRGGFDADQATVDADVAALERIIAAHHDELAGFIVEPLMQAAGGFNFYSPRYLQAARKLCDKYDLLLIFDEVATGFGRTGAMFAADLAGVSPDIMVLGKGLTAGYASHSATLANERVFDQFHVADMDRAFMHGPTFMGNALTAAVSLKSIELLQRDPELGAIQRIERQLREELTPLLDGKASAVRDIRVLGATGVVEATETSAVAGLQDFAAERGVWLRPFENYAYTMPPYLVTEEELRRITRTLREWFNG